MVNLITTILALQILHLAVSAANDFTPTSWLHNCSSTDGNYTIASTYKTNLNSLFNETLTTKLDSGFYNFSAGQSPDIAYLISLCLGNEDVTSCHTCQNFVINATKSLCPSQKTVIAWSDDCLVRYSNEPIFGILAEQPPFHMLKEAKASNRTPEEYNNAVSKLLDSLPANASVGDSRLKFAAGQAEYNSTVTIYAAAQCTPDLTQKECLDCLNEANSMIQTCPECKGQRGARALLPNCMIRFEENKFYLSIDSPDPSTGPSLRDAGSGTTVNAATKEKNGSRFSIVAIAVAGACFLSSLF